MKKLSRNLAMYICMFVAVFCAMTLRAEAANMTSGTIGDNNGITWTYNADTKTLTITGEDSGLRGYRNSPFVDICNDVEIIIMKNCTPVGSVYNLFKDLKSLKCIEFDNFNTENITNMTGMFYNCASLTELDLGSFNTSKVTDMSTMFYGCSSLVSLDLSSFDTSNVESMTFMFYGCESLVSVDVSSFNTSKVEYMYSMFEDCKSLVSLDLRHFDTSKLQTLYGMFHRCVSLESLDISRFNTSNVNDISYLFSGCNNLTSLDLSSFDLSKVGRAIDVFNTFDNNTMLILLRTPRNMPEELSLQLPTSYKDLNSYDKYSDTMYLTGKYCNTTLIKRSYRLEGIELNECSINIPVGNSSQLSVTVFPIGAPIKEIKWTTSDRSVATVDDGKVSAIRPGTVTITARVTDVTGATADALCEVRVVLPVTQIVLSEKTLNLKTGATHTLRAVVGPDNATIKDVVWTTSDKLVATVDEYGIVKAVGPGNAVITATAVDGSGKNASCEVTVIQPVTGVSLEPATLNMNIGESETLTVNISPANASNQEVTWSVAHSGAQVVNVYGNGEVTAVGVGTATITVKTMDGNFSASCEVTVKDPVAEQRKSVKAFVERMYTVALGRTAEAEGLEFYTTRLLSGDSNGACIAESFLCSPEFLNKGHSDAEYVKVLYRTFFNREPAAEEVNYWVNKLASGETKAFVLSGFVNSYEFDNLCTSYGISRGFMREDGKPLNPGIGRFAERLYTVVLERAGEKEGIEYWSLNMANGVCTPKDAAKNFFLSPEYINKNTSDAQYITTLYRTFMDREPEAGGVEYWQNVLNNGATREQILEGFADSAEFKGIMANFGL